MTHDKYGKIHTDGSRSGGQPLNDSIEAKALAMVNEVRKERGWVSLPTYRTDANMEALCRAIEQHEATMKERDSLAVALRATSAACADHVKTIIKLKQEMHDFRQKMSDALQEYIECFNPPTWHRLNHFIIPKPDPLVKAMEKMGWYTAPNGPTDADDFRAALDALGFEIREKGQ